MISHKLRGLQEPNNKENTKNRVAMNQGVFKNAFSIAVCVPDVSMHRVRGHSVQGALFLHLRMGSRDKLKFVQQYLYPLSIRSAQILCFLN